MKKENKGSKSKYTIFTLIVCVIAVLSGKPISEVISDVSSSQETVAIEETYNYDYEETDAQSIDAAEETDIQDTAASEVADIQGTDVSVESDTQEIVLEETEISDHTFRSKKLLNDHYKKHGLEMGFDSAQEYVENANRVISSPDVLYKLEEEDNDHVYYLEETNEFVVVSQDGYIRTYFNPSAGIDYFNRQ